MASRIQYGELHLYPRTQMLTVPLPLGDAGTAITIGFMRMAAQWGQRDPQIRQLALDIVRDVRKNDTAGEIQAVFDWVKQNIQFRGELDETVQAPQVTVRYEAGDCDDHSTLVAALLGSIGYQWNFKTVAIGGNDYSHVYAEVQDHASGEWVQQPHPDWLPLDTTVDEAEPGWEPSGISRATLWPGNKLGNTMRRGRYRLRGLLGDESTGEQISDVISAATPIAVSVIRRGSPGYSYPGNEQYGISVYTPVNIPITQRSWFWPTVIGAGLFTVFSLGGGFKRGR